MKRSPRRRTKQDHIVSSAATLDHELYRIRRQEQYLSFVVLREALDSAVVRLFQRREEMTPADCDAINGIFQEVQQAAQHALAALEAPDLECGARPYPLLLRLWSFHRMLVEAQVLVRGVRGLCARDRLSFDLTGMYPQLRASFRAIVRYYREILGGLAVEVVPTPPLSVQTDIYPLLSQQTKQYAATA